MEPPDPSKSIPRRVDRLQERTAEDIAALAHEYAGLAKTEAKDAGKRAGWPAAIGALGGLLCVVGVGMLAASPAVPRRQRRLRRRMRAVATGYMVVGGAAAIGGALLVATTIARALPRTRHGVANAVDTLRQKL